MSKRVNFYTHGILGHPGDADNWNGKAVTHTMVETERRGDLIVAEKVEYRSGATWSRALFQKARAQRQLKTMERYDKGYRRRLIGHSNGCDVILDALRLTKLEIEELHLVNAACDDDCKANGLNNLVKSGQVDKVFIYMAGRDLALRLAKVAGWIWGYGHLGTDGMQNASDLLLSRATTIHWPEWGHSECWSEGNFIFTMENFIT